LMRDLVAQNLVNGDDFDRENPLGFLTAEGVASSLPEAAYRFCRWEPGMDVILSGTGSVEHLRDNAASLSLPPLPDAVTERLRQLFARIDSVSGN
jgi:L-galactose dehydrogenase